MDEKRVIATIRKVMPAVVSIMIEKNLQDLEKEIPHSLYSFLPGHEHAHRKPKKFKIPDMFVDSKGMVQVGGGSGFIVDSKGLILTNKHVVSDAKAEHTVILDDGRRFPAEIVTRDPINDIAILRIKASRLPTVRLGNAHKAQLGQSVIAIGNALGVFKNTVSLGIVAGLSRSISARENPDGPSQELRGLIQTDAAVNTGNSGGPLVDLDGRAIAINAAIISGAQNIGFAIPINAAERDLSDLRRYGRIRRPFLGLRYLVLDENLRAKMKLPVGYGAYVIPEPRDPGVVPGSPADNAGLKERDIVLKFGGKKVDIDHPIQDYLETMKVGQTVRMEILRGKSKFEASVTLTERT